jgi:hypothetical protein
MNTRPVPFYACPAERQNRVHRRAGYGLPDPDGPATSRRNQTPDGRSRTFRSDETIQYGREGGGSLTDFCRAFHTLIFLWLGVRPWLDGFGVWP